VPASGQCLPKTEKRTRNHPGRALVWLGSGVLRSLAELNGVNQGEGGQDFLQVIDSANFQGRIIIRFIFFAIFGTNSIKQENFCIPNSISVSTGKKKNLVH